MIDERSRPSCFMHALPKIKPGGIIVWDNTDREHYWPAMRLVPPTWKFFDFPEPTAYAPQFYWTSAWGAV